MMITLSIILDLLMMSLIIVKFRWMEKLLMEFVVILVQVEELYMSMDYLLLVSMLNKLNLFLMMFIISFLIEISNLICMLKSLLDIHNLLLEFIDMKIILLLIFNTLKDNLLTLKNYFTWKLSFNLHLFVEPDTF